MLSSDFIGEKKYEQVKRMLEVILYEILPKTEKGVEKGNKVFGAAILEKKELETIVADTNNETKCPLFHGEVYVIQKWAETPANSRIAPSETIFLSTHEPCCMCISAIVWAGFKQVFYLFPYETTRDQGIPHDIEIMKELWGVDRYVVKNKFCTTYSIIDAVNSLQDDEQKSELRALNEKIREKYNQLSSEYHSNKPSKETSGIFFD